VAPSPRSLILDLLSTLRRGSFPVGALVAAGGFFGLEEGAVRVALARLLEAGRVERAGRGRYRLGAEAAAVRGRAFAWRRAGERTRPWDGGWVGVAGPVGDDRSGRERAERALRLVGFRELVRGLRVRPDNLAGGVSAVRDTLQGLGLPSPTPVVRLDDLDAATALRARGLWDAQALRRRWRTLRASLERSERRLPRLAAPAARVESFLVGGRALREVALDPLLPEAIVPAGEREALVSAMRRYDRIGRACWAPFLEEHGVLSPHAPTDTRGAADAATLAAGGVP
jgi:phenylacetic acid degradation operon negative regulatory protein